MPSISLRSMVRLVMRVGLLALIVFLSGCVYIPPVWDAGDEIYHLDFIEPGVTTKDQVLAQLGEPHRSQEMDDGTSYWYWGNKSEGAMAMYIPPMVLLGGLVEESLWVVRIEFDKNDVVSKFTSTRTEPVSVPTTFPASQAGPTQYFKLQLKKACGGDKLAQFVVAKSYDSGEGIERDRVEAYKWYTLAESEWPESNNFKDRLRRQMTLAEIVEAERHAAEWRPGNCEAELEEAGISPTN